MNTLSAKFKKSYVQYIIAICAVWLTLFILFAFFIFNHEIETIEEKFLNIHNKIYEHLVDKTKIYDVSIESFASVLTTESSNDYKNARRFAQQLRIQYPDIYMLEIAKRTSRDERYILEKNMQDSGYSNFVIHTFSYDGDRKSHVSTDKDIYYPIVFIEPELKASMGVLGLDLSDSSSVLKDALERSFDKQTHVASKPFKLIEKNRGYILYREVRTIDIKPRPELVPKQKLYALLVVNTSKLIPDWAYNTKGLSFFLQYPGLGLNQDANLIGFSGNLEQAQSWPFSLLPEFSKTSVLRNQSQPFKLLTQYRVQWLDLDLKAIIIYLIFAASAFPIAFWFSMILYRKKIENIRQQEKHYRLAKYDELTGLPNKMHAKELFYQKVNFLKRNKKNLALLFIDFNRFKEINDSYGHKVGDLLLKHASKRINSVLRETDILARLHGDEFVIFLDNIDSPKNVKKVISHINSKFETPFILNGISITISLSIGVSNFPDDGDSFDALLDVSDKKMYEEKNKGKHSIVHLVSKD